MSRVRSWNAFMILVSSLFYAVIESISNNREPQPGFEAMYLLMPTTHNINRIIKDFTNHKQYAGAHLFFIEGDYLRFGAIDNLLMLLCDQHFLNRSFSNWPHHQPNRIYWVWKSYSYIFMVRSPLVRVETCSSNLPQRSDRSSGFLLKGTELFLQHLQSTPDRIGL